MTNSATVNFIQSTNHSITTATDTLVTNDVDITTIITTSAVDLNVITTAAHTIAQSVNHNGGSFTTIINTFITTDLTTVATQSSDLSSFTAITNSADTITTFSSSPTLSTSQSNDRSVYSSVGALVVIAVVLLVVFIIIAVIIIAVCYKRKRRKRCTKQGPIKLEEQGKKDPNTKGIQAGRAITEDHYYSIPFENQVKMQHKQVKMQGNPTYSGMNTSTEVKYYNVSTVVKMQGNPAYSAAASGMSTSTKVNYYNIDTTYYRNDIG